MCFWVYAKFCSRRIVFLSKLFVVEDTEENVAEATKKANERNVPINSFQINKSDQANSLRLLAQQIDKINTKTLFDMDDTLIHEAFRKEHQPINIYLELRALGLI